MAYSKVQVVWWTWWAVRAADELCDDLMHESGVEEKQMLVYVVRKGVVEVLVEIF
jgi:hypothetical protein